MNLEANGAKGRAGKFSSAADADRGQSPRKTKCVVLLEDQCKCHALAHVLYRLTMNPIIIFVGGISFCAACWVPFTDFGLSDKSPVLDSLSAAFLGQGPEKSKSCGDSLRRL